MANKDDVQVVVKAVDEFTKAMNAFKQQLIGQEQAAGKTEKAVRSLGDRVTSFGNYLKQGFIGEIGRKAFDLINDGVHALISAIPDLIARGQEWAELVKSLQLESGMTAEQTSTLAAVMQHLGMDTEMLDRTFAMFGKQLGTNEDLFAKLGIATRDANGNLLDAYTILGNTRQRFQQAGESLTTTAAAQELFSRSGYKMLEFLQLSDEEFAALARSASEAGVVLDQDTIDAAERMERTWSGLWQQINGVAVQAFAALEPTIESFVANVSAWIKAHMADIMRFVVAAANLVLGFIGGLLGLDWSIKDVAASLVDTGDAAQTVGNQMADAGKKASGGEDAVTKAVNAQIDAIQRKIDALDRARNARKAEEEEADLEKAIADARQELADLQNSALNTYGLSAAERIKAQQKRASDIAEAQKKIADAEGKLQDYRTDQAQDAERQRLEDEKKALQDQLKERQKAAGTEISAIRAVGGAATDMGRKLKQAIGEVGKPIDDLKATAEEWRRKGTEAAEWLKVKLAQVAAVVGGIVAWGAGAIGVVADVVNALGGFSIQLGPFKANIIDVAGALLLLVNPAGGLLLLLANHLDVVGQVIGTVIDGIVKAVQWLHDTGKAIPIIGPIIFGGADEVGGALVDGPHPGANLVDAAKKAGLIPPAGGSGGSGSGGKGGNIGGKKQMAAGGTIFPGDWGTVGEYGIEDFRADQFGVHITPRSAPSGPTILKVYLTNGRHLFDLIDEGMGRARQGIG